MFVPHVPPLDAVVATAERGSAFTLLHPEYSVAVPKPRPFKVPLAYVIAGRDSAMTAVVDTWIELKRKDGTIDELFAHWILGQDAAPKRPRWSILDDVLRRSRPAIAVITARRNPVPDLRTSRLSSPSSPSAWARRSLKSREGQWKPCSGIPGRETFADSATPSSIRRSSRSPGALSGSSLVALGSAPRRFRQ